MSPELAAHLACLYPAGGNWRSQVWYYIHHDIRHQVLWKFGVILYGILHGFWPWDTPPPGGHQEDLLDYDGNFHNRRVHTRRWNIINRDLPIDANLSQDSRDVLQAMFSKHPGDRPTLPKLMTFSWFSKWVDEDQQFWRRPYSKAFQMDSWQQK
jgi:serine/threonine protein kinase